MAKKEKEKPTLKLDGEDYDMDSMSDTQKTMINHLTDLDRKIQGSEFNLVQLRFGKQAFVDALKVSLKNGSSQASLLPSNNNFNISYKLNYDHPLIKKEEYSIMDEDLEDILEEDEWDFLEEEDLYEG